MCSFPGAAITNYHKLGGGWVGLKRIEIYVLPVLGSRFLRSRWGRTTEIQVGQGHGDPGGAGPLRPRRGRTTEIQEGRATEIQAGQGH